MGSDRKEMAGRPAADDGIGERLQAIPSVDELLRLSEVDRWGEAYPRTLIVRAIRESVDAHRHGIRSGKVDTTDVKTLVREARERLECIGAPAVTPVINATGVVVHTNLGRSLLAAEALAEAVDISSRYSNLEFDLRGGGRGHRDLLVRDLIVELTGAEDALVVNNNAAAVLLALTALARGREVVVSRGELIEIGGSFRIPDVMAAGGACLREVGTTNRTRLSDYERVIGEETALLLKVHPSNYRIVGFSGEVTVQELATLGRRRGLPVLYDLGSGALMDLAPFGIPGEPAVRDVVGAGADLLTFSGDKLLGGPQGGVIVGRKDLVETLRRHPLARALRVDKLTLAAFEGTLRLYRDPETALAKIPTLRMITLSPEVLRRRAGTMARRMKTAFAEKADIRTMDGASRAGGGSLPELDLPTRLVGIRPRNLSAGDLAERLRQGREPVIVRVHEDEVLLDPRTMQEGDLATVVWAVEAALG